MKKLLAALISMIVALIVVASWSSDSQPVATQYLSVGERSSKSPQGQIHMHQYAAKGRVPAYFESPPDIRTLPQTLSPEIFTGNKRLAYQAAKEIPQTLAQLPCYCHCDRGEGHKSLHSCFQSEHGENCGICIGEALMAYNLEKQGVTVSEIRKQIVNAYGQR
jgi:hypothetical protein